MKRLLLCAALALSTAAQAQPLAYLEADNSWVVLLSTVKLCRGAGRDVAQIPKTQGQRVTYGCWTLKDKSVTVTLGEHEYTISEVYFQSINDAVLVPLMEV